MINYLALFIALALSVVAAYYSIIGLAVIFASALIPVIVMASTLEAAKVVAASWLYRNWDHCPRWIKYYLVVAVVILMFITSMGIFGFLSKAHLDQTVIAGDTSIELKLLDQQIQSEQRIIENAQRSLSAMDRLVDQSDTETSIRLRNQQGRERKLLNDSISTSANKIKDLNNKALPLRKENLKIQAEVGPIKYIADLIYGDSTEQLLEKAVRAVIIIIVLVFDPLAIALLLAANHGIRHSKKPELPELFDKIVLPKFNRKQIETKEPISNGLEKSKPKRTRNQKKTPEQWEVEKKKPPRWENDQKPEWVDKVEELKDKKKKGIVEIDKAAIARMK